MHVPDAEYRLFQLLTHLVKGELIGAFLRYDIEIGGDKLILAESEILANPSLHPVSRHCRTQFATGGDPEPGPFGRRVRPDNNEVLRM